MNIIVGIVFTDLVTVHSLRQQFGPTGTDPDLTSHYPTFLPPVASALQYECCYVVTEDYPPGQDNTIFKAGDRIVAVSLFLLS